MCLARPAAGAKPEAAHTVGTTLQESGGKCDTEYRGVEGKADFSQFYAVRAESIIQQAMQIPYFIVLTFKQWRSKARSVKLDSWRGSGGGGGVNMASDSRSTSSSINSPDERVSVSMCS